MPGVRLPPDIRQGIRNRIRVQRDPGDGEFTDAVDGMLIYDPLHQDIC